MPRSDIGSGGLTETFLASAARTTNGQTATVGGFGSAVRMRLQVNVTAVGGVTPTLDVVVEDSVDGGLNWNTVGTFAQKTAVSREVINITSPFGEHVRVRWTVGGATPSFTFAVDGYTE